MVESIAIQSFSRCCDRCKIPLSRAQITSYISSRDIAKSSHVRSRNALVLIDELFTSCSLPLHLHVDGIDKGPSLFDDALTPD